MSCFVDVGRIYEVCMNPTLNGSWAIQHLMQQCNRNRQRNNLGILHGSVTSVLSYSLLQVSANRLLVAVKTDYHDLTLIRPLVYLLSSRHLLPSPVSIENEVAESILTLSLHSFTDSQGDPLALRLALDCCSLVRVVCFLSEACCLLLHNAWWVFWRLTMGCPDCSLKVLYLHSKINEALILFVVKTN